MPAKSVRDGSDPADVRSTQTILRKIAKRTGEQISRYSSTT
jgi:hypothetical protein